MKKILVICIAISLFSCDNNEITFSKKETYLADSIKAKGRFMNGNIKDGVFFIYYPTGEIRSISFYENDIRKKNFFFLFDKKRKLETYVIE